MNEQQQEYLKRRRKQTARRRMMATNEKYTEALREVKKVTALCEHCDTFIQLDEVFGWYHGDMNGDWNTTCNDGTAETRAEPTPEEV